jgi:hypothetical protein
VRKEGKTIRLGAIGMGLDNMASTLTLLSEVENLNCCSSGRCRVAEVTEISFR